MRGRTLSLKPGANVVGSSGECDVMLPGGDVLPQHLVFNVGELVVSVQRVGAAAVELNGEPMQAPRRSVVAGDVLRVGSVELQLDRVYVTLQERDPMFAGPESVLPPAAQEALAVPAPRPLRRVGVAVVVLSLVGIVGLSVWSGRSDARRAATPGANLQAVEQLIKPYPEVEAVALAGGGLNVRGYVESRARREALRQALAPYGGAVSVNVVSADDMIEQARRFVSDPGVTIAYAGQGRLVVSGTVEDEAVRQQIRRLGEDLHPMVLVSDKVTYRPRPVRDDGGAEARAQWEAWQNVLPARMVGITEDASGLKYIQLANGNRYYEGALLRSGAELKRIDADGLVLSGGEPPKERK
ncbi:MAG: forkhead-associated protein [Rhizobacter sp.]|nr:forkhead-associated protein [Rhizobacter sp.]